MTQLQKIVAKAKTLRKSYPNTKWTDLIKKASKLVTPASKSVAGTKKKKAIKKIAVKKVARKKSIAKKSPARSLHKDTKSHNVNIRVMSGAKRSKSRSVESEAIRHIVKKDGFIMPHGYGVEKSKKVSGLSGIGNLTLDQLKRNTEVIERLSTKTIPYMMEQLRYAPTNQKSFIKGRILEAKKYIATLKKQNTGLKKHIK